MNSRLLQRTLLLLIALVSGILLVQYIVTPDKPVRADDCAATYHEDIVILLNQPLSRDELRRWIRANHGTPDTEISLTLNGLSWNKATAQFSSYSTEGTIAFVETTIKSATAADLLRCFGEPELYDAGPRVGADVGAVVLALWYPRDSTFVYGVDGDPRIFDITAENTFDWVTITRFRNDLPLEDRVDFGALRPWEGQIEYRDASAAKRGAQ